MNDAVTELRCPECGIRNRLPAARVADAPSCGRCKSVLLPGRPVASSDGSFAEDVLASPIPALVDFWAPWCGPCRSIAPVLDEVAREQAGRVRIVKVDVDESPQSATRFGIRSIPALKLFRGGQIVDEIVGAAPASTIHAFLARNGV